MAASPLPAPESARHSRRGRGLRLRAHWGLSSGQTIDAARTAVRSACCLPELRVANRLRRLCPPGTRFPSFPPFPFGPGWRENPGACLLAEKTKGFPRGKQSARFALPCGPLTVCLHLRGPHSALSLPPTPKQAVRTNVRTACFWEPRMPVRGHSTKFSCRLPAALAEVSVAQTRRGLILPLFAQTGQNQNNDCDQIGERFENLLHAPI